MHNRRYPLPVGIAIRLAVAGLSGQRRSFSQDARACVRALDPPVQVMGKEHLPGEGPRLLLTNHYSRPGFPAWWIALAVTATGAAGVTPAATTLAPPDEVHWVITAAWTFPGRRGRRLLMPLSRWVIRKISRVYGFTPMPPMPPAPEETAARARAVREVLRCARDRRASIGLAPEGRDDPGGVLQMPPPGAGRFLLHLAGLGLAFTPVGVFEAPESDGRSWGLCVRFGPAFCLEVPPGLPAGARDAYASRLVMGRLAAVLPEALRGEFG